MIRLYVMVSKLPGMINIFWIFKFQSIYGKSYFPAILTYLRFVCEEKGDQRLGKTQIYLFCKREKLFQLFKSEYYSCQA